MRYVGDHYILENSTEDFLLMLIHAEVVTRVAGSLEAGGLPGYPESSKPAEDLTKLGSTLFSQIMRAQVLELYTNNLYKFYITREKNDMSVQVEGWQTSPS